MVGKMRIDPENDGQAQFLRDNDIKTSLNFRAETTLINVHLSSD